MYSLLKNINAFLWGPPIIVLLLITHLFFTYYFKGIQKQVLRGIRLSISPSPGTKKTSSPFHSLSTMLAATLGTGNIIGMSTAIALGGPGAVFWCWLTGVFGMATSYAECYFSMLYRKKDENNLPIGGPMYVLKYGLNLPKIAVFYAVCVILVSFGVGCTTQSNAISDTMQSLWHLPAEPIGIITSLITGFVIIGGISSIGKICSYLVPAMTLFYLCGCFIILILNHHVLWPSLITIFRSAFSAKCMYSGLSGYTVGAAMRYGISRGLFTNEAGLGSGAIAAASSSCSDPHKQALISMTAVFWDTVIMCAITGIVIVSNIIKNPTSIANATDAGFTHAAFASLGIFGKYFLGIAIIAFALSTLIGWCYFGECAARFLWKNAGIFYYKVIYLVMIFLGAVLSLELVWEITDFFNAIMLIPNLIALFGLPLKKKCTPGQSTSKSG